MNGDLPTVRFDQGVLVCSRRPANPAGWHFDDRRLEWIAPAILNSQSSVSGFVPEWTEVRWSRENIVPLRKNQAAAVAAWMSGKRGQVIMPTGTGKTEVALEIMRQTGVSTLVVAPVRDLMYQWHRRIQKALGYDSGIIGDNLFNVRPVSCTTYDSAAIHMDKLGSQFKLIIFDEEHHLPGRFFSQAATLSAAPWRLGLTATPERADARHHNLADLVGPVCFRQTIAEVKGSILADYDIVQIPVWLSEEGQAEYDRLGRIVSTYVTSRREKDRTFDFRKLCSESSFEPAAREAMHAFRKRKAIENRAGDKLRILEDIFILHPGARVIVFVGSNAMARDVSIRFLIPALLSHCGKEERAEILDRFSTGAYHAIVANQVLDEGVDVPAAKVAVVLGGMASSRQADQRLGRILRPSGGHRAVLYEVVCKETGEVQRSRQRRKTDAYKATSHRKI